ncbi:MAG: FtsW/RodA/SpoVE family cell cycle protein [Lachnospiraceae bacterium]|nr:FtsW/RodA/SpoVE family cell cycle protein [Lachnospiraceae bacterium]
MGKTATADSKIKKVPARQESGSKGKKRRGYSLVLPLALVMAGLLIWGLFMIFSSSAYSGGVGDSEDIYEFLKRQLLAEVVGVIMMIIIYSDLGGFVISFARRKIPRIMIVIAAASSVIMLLFFGITRNGATRWFQVAGLSIQPAELVKIAVIIFLAGLAADYPKLCDTFRGYCFFMLVPAVLAILVYSITDNLSSALIIGGIAAALGFVASSDVKVHLILLGVVSAGVWAYIEHVSKMTYTDDINYRVKRIMVWLRPEEHLREGGYQPLQALYAIGSGGLTGKGIGRSIQKLGTIPEVHNDMIFSVICEETGLVGAALLLMAFAALIVIMAAIAWKIDNIYGKMLVIGVMAHIAIQVILNVMVVTALMPNTGVSLPFISYGGSSVLFLMMEMGMVFRVAKDNNA